MPVPTFTPFTDEFYYDVDRVRFDQYLFNFAVPVPFKLQPNVLPLGSITIPLSSIPYNVLAGPTFEWGVDEATAQEIYIISAENVHQFVTAVLPPPDSEYDVAGTWPGSVRYWRKLPGNPLFLCKRISIEPTDPAKPIDPYGTDPRRLYKIFLVPGANPEPGVLEQTVFGQRGVFPIRDDDGKPSLATRWLQSYGQFVKVNLTYQYDAFHSQEVKVNDPSTFTEESMTIGGEFLNIGQQETRFAKSTNTGLTIINANPTNLQDINNIANHVYVDLNLAGGLQGNGDFDTPVTLLISTVEHTLTWPDVWDPPWMNIRLLLGKINNATLPWLKNAARETVLFVGATARKQSNTTLKGERLWTLEYRFVEKRIQIIQEASGTSAAKWAILTWNHFYRPGSSGTAGKFEYLVVNSTGKKLYEPVEMGILFTRDLKGVAQNAKTLELLHNSERGMIPLRPHHGGYRNTQQPGGNA